MASIFDSIADDQSEGPEKPAKRRSIFDSGSKESGANEEALAEKRERDRTAPTLGASYPKGKDRGYSPVFWKNSVDMAMDLPKPVPTPPGEIPTRGPYQPPGPTGGPAQPEAPEPTTLGRLIRGKGWLELGADAADIVVGGIPALVAGSYADLDQRMQALIKGQGWRAGGKAGAEASRQIGEAIGRPIYDNLVAAGLIDKGTRSIPMQAMDKVGSFLERSAETFEKDTGMPKEDYLSLVNGFMAAMGVKGAGALIKHGVQVPGVPSARIKGLDQRVAEGQKSAWDAALERYNAEEQLARERFEAGAPNRAAAESVARPGVDSLYGGNFAAEAAARKEAFLRRKAREKGIADFPPSGERTGSRDGILLNLEGKETPTSQPGNQPFHTADATAALKRGIVADTPIETQGRLAPAGPTSLDSGLAKVREGRLFDMTPEERIAVRGSREITDPKIITAAAVGATGLGLAMMYEPSPEEAAMAIGAGALLRRGGVGESLAELRARPAATPLGALLEASAYTTSTLEKLADASPGRFEFKKAQVEQLLKREGVTKHERDLMTKALEATPGDTVTAKDLMVGLKVAAGDFELTPEKSNSYAAYGLERIGREALNPDLAVELDLPAGGHGDLQPTTRIYRSPLELGSNNHFGDPNYFAHTRSFVEDGVRHVVELQSDLAQKAGKVPSPEVIAEAKRSLAVSEALDATWSDVQYGVSRAGNYSFFDGLQRFFKREPELNRILGHDDQLGMLEEKLWRTASYTTDPVLQKVAEEFHANWEKTATPQLREGYAQGWVDISGGFAEWLIKNKDRLANDRSETTLRYALQELANRKTQEALVGISEAKSKLTAGNVVAVAPMLKDWHKRLVREELADAARNLEGSVRFATADTVAKVEGWPKEVRYKEGATAFDPELKKSSRVGSITSDEGIRHFGEFRYTGNLKVVGGRIFGELEGKNGVKFWSAESTRIRSEEAAKALGQSESFRPEHQGIYDRYQKDVEKFLRQLGGKPYTDSAGHTWLEVPLGEQQKALSGGGARTQIGALAAGTALAASYLFGDDEAAVAAAAGMPFLLRKPNSAGLRNRQIGGVDPALLKGVAAVGGTAALAWMLSADKDKARHAGMAGVLTGLGMLLKSRVPAIAAMVQKTVDGIQAVGGNLSTDRAVTEPLLRRLTEHARAELKGIHDAGRAVAPFLEIASRLPVSVQKDLNVALMNGSSSGIVAAVGRAAAPGLLKEWNNVQAQLKKFAGELKSVGLLETPRPDYFPRIVKDLPGLLNAIGKDYAVPLQRALDAAEKKAGMPLDEAERAAIVNKFIEKNLRGQSGEGKASFFKRRTIDNVTIDLEPFYVEPLQALPLYIGSATRAIERARFFGKDAVRDPVTGKLDLSNSIGNVVAKEIDAGNLTPENYTRLTKLLETRFGPAYGAPDRPFQALGQFTNIALLGNVFSGMMNLADIGTIAAQHGVVPLAAALAAKVGKRQKITAADVGMAEHIMEEFVYGTREPVKMRVPLTERTVQISLAKALDKTFKYSGFKFFDQTMKEVALNAAFEKYSRLSRTKAGEARIIRQYSNYFTSDMPQLLADLRAGAKTKLTTELAFRELSDAQPVTKVEMPQFYLDHPNLRFGFALKSFMIKQVNLIKRRGVREIARGNFREGVGFLTRYALMAGAAGATMDWVVKSLLGRDADTDWSTIPFNALKNFGLSEYVIDKMRQGKGKEALLAFATPPVDPIMKILSADPEAVRYFPLVGRLFYDRAMDGAEKANAAKKLQEKKKRQDAERTPEERRELLERALERRKRLLEEQ